MAFGCTTAHSPSIAERLDALIADLHTREMFAGAAVVSRDGDIVFEKGVGFADVDARVPFTPDTAADGASLAKTFTAELLLQLADEGRLSLDAPAQTLLQELPYPDLTLRHLLTHSNGLPD